MTKLLQTHDQMVEFGGEYLVPYEQCIPSHLEAKLTNLNSWKTVYLNKIFYDSLLLWRGAHKVIVNEPAFDYFKNNYFKIIHLKRINKLDTILSNKLVRRTGGDLPPDKWPWFMKPYIGPIEINYEKCLESFIWLSDWQTAIDDALKSYNIEHIDIYYEQLIKDQLGTINSIFNFLGIQQLLELVEIDLKKQRIGKQSDNIINYAELKEKFRNSKYFQYFED